MTRTMEGLNPAAVDRGALALGQRRPRVLVYTSLFPNSVQPIHGNFILERMRYLIPFVDMTVVAPVPYFPRIKIKKEWFRFASVPHTERFANFDIDHPRYVVIPRIGMSTHAVSMFAGSLKQVTKRLTSMEYDLIDAHYVYPDGLAAIMLGARFNKPVVVSARGSDINLFSNFITIRPKLRRVLKRAAKVIAVSQALKNTMIDLGCEAEKIAVIRNGIDAEKFAPQPRAGARRKLGLNEDRQIVLSVGKLSENKGFSILIDAVARLSADYPKLMFVIVGDGTYRSYLETQIRNLGLQNVVRLVGTVPHEELSVWYSAADLFCLASLREGCPNVVLEALACGCPVVATRTGGVPELISSSSLGILVERTADGFEAGLRDALGRSWDQAAIVRHSTNHRWDTVAAQLLDVYSKVIAAHS